MNIEYKFKHASKLTEKEQKKAEKLRLKDIGVMWDDWVDLHDKKKCFVVTATYAGGLVGWGLAYWNKPTKEWNFSIFVRKSYRRNGIGTKIYKVMKKNLKVKHNQLRVYRHDEQSIAFYDTIQIKP